MKNILFVLTLLLIGVQGIGQVKTQKDSAVTKVLETDDYSNIRNNPNNSRSKVRVIDKATKKEVEKSNLEIYNEVTAKADAYYYNNDYANAVSLYQLAFKSNGDKGRVKHRYNLACSYTILNKRDLALDQLERIAFKGGYYNHLEITSEKKLEPLHSDPRWDKIIQRIKLNSRAIQDRLNIQLKMQDQGL